MKSSMKIRVMSHFKNNSSISGGIRNTKCVPLRIFHLPVYTCRIGFINELDIRCHVAHFSKIFGNELLTLTTAVYLFKQLATGWCKLDYFLRIPKAYRLSHGW